MENYTTTLWIYPIRYIPWTLSRNMDNFSSQLPPVIITTTIKVVSTDFKFYWITTIGVEVLFFMFKCLEIHQSPLRSQDLLQTDWGFGYTKSDTVYRRVYRFGPILFTFSIGEEPCNLSSTYPDLLNVGRSDEYWTIDH